MRQAGLVVIVLSLAVLAGRAEAYILQPAGYDGHVYLNAADNQGWSSTTTDPYTAVATHPWYWGTMSAQNANLSAGGGTGAGTYQIGDSTCTVSSFNGTGPNLEWLDIHSEANTVAVYSWTLLSEYGNTGVVTLNLASGGWKQEWTPGGSGSAAITVSSGIDFYQGAPTTSIDPDYCYWNDSVSFDVLIGSTITVVCLTTGRAYGGLTDSGAIGGGGAEASFTIPVEVPDPTTIALLATGSLLAVRRRRTS